MNDFGVDVTPEEATEMFNAFDTDRTGKLSFDELLVALRPPMRKCRRDLVMKAFKKLDRTNTGEITIEDLRVCLDSMVSKTFSKIKIRVSTALNVIQNI